MWAAARCIGSLAQWPAGVAVGACRLHAGLPLPPRSSWLLLWLLLTGFTGAMRFASARSVAEPAEQAPPRAHRVAIYGAGAAGVQLAAALRLAGSHSVELFLDDDPVALAPRHQRCADPATPDPARAAR